MGELDDGAPVKLVRKQLKNNKVDPLKRKKSFKVNGNSANAAFQPPAFPTVDFSSMFGQSADEMTLGQMGGFGSGNVDESEISDYNSEYDALGIMSPAPDGATSDASCTHFKYNNLNYNTDASFVDDCEFTDFQEEELPKHFFNMTESQRYEWAKNKRIDPLLIEYRYAISNEIERDLEYNKQRLLMLCRLLRSKSQEYESRVEIEQNKYQSLTAQYNAKKEDNYKLRKQNNNLEKEYEKVENERVAILRNIKNIKLDLNEKKKKIKHLEKQLSLKTNELNIERSNQLQNEKTSILRKKVHEKYGTKFAKKIERNVIKNNSKDL